MIVGADSDSDAGVEDAEDEGDMASMGHSLGLDLDLVAFETSWFHPLSM